MSALLRSGKFLRVVSGFARNTTAGSSNNDKVFFNGGGNGTSIYSNSNNCYNAGFKTWSTHYVQNALPYLGAVIDDDDEETAVKDTVVNENVDDTAEEEKIISNAEDDGGGGRGIDDGKNNKKLNKKRLKPLIIKKLLKSDNDTSNEGQNRPEVESKSQATTNLVTDSHLSTPPTPPSSPQIPSANNWDKVSNKTEKKTEISTQTDEEEDGHSIRSPSLLSTTMLPDDLIPVIQLYDPMSGQYQIFNLTEACELFFRQGRVWDLENLCHASRPCRRQDRQNVFLYTLRAYIAHGYYDRILKLSENIVYEGLDFPEFRNTFNSCFYPPSVASTPSLKASTFNSSSEPSPSEDSLMHRKFKKTLTSTDNLDEALKTYKTLEGKGKKVLNVTETSTLIELLIKAERIDEASEVTDTMLKRNTYPLPKIFRFLLNKLAMLGKVEAMERIGSRLSSKVKREVSFDNRLCNAYLAAGRGEQFLEKLQSQLDSAKTSQSLTSAQERFPRGGAMGLLETYPELVTKYAKLAHDYAKGGYIAPINVLWTYLFINGKHDEAKPLWDRYLAPSSQIMFQKICQMARSTGDVEMAKRLVDLLYDANVTSGAQGIAYSCLLDVLSQKNDYLEGLSTLKRSFDRGVRISDINRTALLRLKKGLETNNCEFPFELPKKSSTKVLMEEEEDDDDRYQQRYDETSLVLRS